VNSPAGFVGRHGELRILGDRLAAAGTGQPQVVYVEGDAGGGKSTLLSEFLGSRPDAVVLDVGGDEDETLLSYGVIDQLRPGTLTDPGTDPMAVGAWLLDLLDRRQAGGRVVVLAIDDLQWADRPSSRAVLFALRRLRADKVLAVVSARAGALADPGWARFVAGDSRVTRIRLGGLTPADLAELVAAARLRTGLPSTYPGPCLAHLSDACFRRGDWDAAATYAQLATSLAQDTDRPLDLARAHARAAQRPGRSAGRDRAGSRHRTPACWGRPRHFQLAADRGWRPDRPGAT
jgi:hypothetical protein